MPSQRKANKTLLSGYVNKFVKDKVKESSHNQTVFVELNAILGLLREKKVTVKEIRELADANRLQKKTIEELKKDGIL